MAKGLKGFQKGHKLGVRKLLPIICENCGKDIRKVSNDVRPKRKFCNVLCYGEFLSKISVNSKGEKRCITCKKLKIADVNFLKRNRSQRTTFRSECNSCTLLRNKKHYKENVDTHRNYAKKSNKKKKLEVISHYSKGKMECACCFEKHIEFLAIDHINGGGNKERKELGRASGSSFYTYLRKEGFPGGFRVLCHNCNVSLGLFGYCPHKK